MKPRGFTLIELVMSMIIVGLLAVAVVPKFFERQSFDARGFYDESKSMLQYAQKTAIAKRRNVCAAISSGTITLSFASAAGPAAPCNTGLQSPLGQTPFSITAPSGIIIAATAASFSFNAIGKTNLASQLDVQIIGDTTHHIFVEPETGYVHGSL